MDRFEPCDVPVARMRAGLRMVADKLEGVVLHRRIVAVRLLGDVPDGQPGYLVVSVIGDHAAAGQIPLLRQIVRLLAEDLVFAGGRLDGLGLGDRGRMLVGLLPQALLLEFLEGGADIVAGLLALFPEPFDPVFLGSSLGEVLLDAELGSDEAADLVDRLAFEHRVDGRAFAAGESGPGGAALDDVGLFVGRGCRQDVIGDHGRGRQIDVVRHDAAQAGILLVGKIEDAQAVVDVGMLVEHDVARVVPDELDRGLELDVARLARIGRGAGRIDRAHAPGAVVHDRVVLDRLVPVEERDAGLDRVPVGEVRQVRGDLVRHAARALARAGAAAGNAHVAGQRRDHRDGARDVAAVGMALRAPALDGRRRAVHVQIGEPADGVGGNAADGGRPFRRLLAGAPVGAGAHEIGLVGHVLVDGKGAVGIEAHERVARRLALLHIVDERIRVEPDELLANERLVEPALRMEIVQHAGDQGGIGAGTDGHPLRSDADGGIGQMRVDDDDVRVGIVLLDPRDEPDHGRA